VWRLGVVIALLILGRAGVAQETPPKGVKPHAGAATPAVEERAETKEPSSDASRAPESENTEKTGVPRNPFAYSDGRTSGYVTLTNARIPSGIQLVGVVVMKGQKPIAAIRIPGESDVLFVTEGSVVQIERPSTKDPKAESAEPLYILISRITTDEVEVSPRTRPEDKRIVR
jgi:hypothetical protein